MKKLHRVDQGSILGGVCTGFANYFDVDVVVFRIIALLFMLAGGGILGYLACWIIIPNETEV